jgi:hypothetical protein
MSNLKGRKFIGFFVILLSLLIAAFLIADKKELSLNDNIGDDKKRGFSLQRENKNLSDFEGDNLSRLLTSQSKDGNMTDIMANKLAQGFFEENQTNKNFEEEGLIVPNPNQLLDDFVGSTEEAINLEKYFIDDNQMNISNDNSQESIIIYYSQYKEIIRNYREKMEGLESLELFSKTNNVGSIVNLIKDFDLLIKDMKKLKVPSVFANLHMRTINTYIAERTILGSMVLIDQDPLRSMMAMELLPEIEDSFELLANDYILKFKELGFEVRIN